jgi:F420H(2)-dependent quinone reductase
VVRAEDTNGPRVSGDVDGVSLLGRLVMWGSQAANRRGLYLGRRSTRIHAAIYRRTGGKLGGHLPGLPSARVLLLDHTGARSGVRRTSPVMYHEDGDAVAVMASKAGQPSHPAWPHNLIANPQTTIQIGSELRHVLARIAADEEGPALAKVRRLLSRRRLLPAPRRCPENSDCDPRPANPIIIFPMRQQE